MDLELVKYYIPFMQAFADGEEIEMLKSGRRGDYWDKWDGCPCYVDRIPLRIKKEPVVFYGNLRKGRRNEETLIFLTKELSEEAASPACPYEFIASKFVQVIDE